MKTRNPSYDRALAVIKGRVSPTRAGSTGLSELTDQTATVDDVDTLIALGGDVQGEDGTGFLSYRSLLAWMTNNSGGTLAPGTVVVIDSSADEAVTTTTTAQATVKIGIVRESIDDGTIGPITIEGYAPLVLVTASVTRGHYAESTTTAGQASGNSARRSGSFGVYVTGGSTPAAILFATPDSSAVGAHHTTHESGGSDAIKLDDLATPDDNTDLNASSSRHGLLPKLPNDATKVLDGTGAFSTISSAGFGAWQSFTPAWTSDGTAPAIGNGTLTGRYRLLDSRSMQLQIHFIRGSSSTNGTGNYFFSLPAGISATGTPALAAFILDSGTRNYAATAILNGASAVYVIHTEAGGGGIFSNGNPMTLATGDQVDIAGMIEVVP